jgi:uncharacterized membrane protein
MTGYIKGVPLDNQQKGVVAMATITDTIDVDVDRSTAYNQWTQFEDFPAFMEGVEEVRQISDTTLHWVTKVGPAVREYDAVITEQEPDQLIAWKAVSGTDNAGRITFQEVDENTTQITAEISIDPEGLVETVGEMTGAIERRVAGDLQRFKEFIESRGQETGAWRGTVHGGSTSTDSGAGMSGGMASGAMASGGIGSGETDSGYMEGGLTGVEDTELGSDDLEYTESDDESTFGTTRDGLAGRAPDSGLGMP